MSKMAEIVPIILEVIEQDKQFILPVKGTSMRPYLLKISSIVLFIVLSTCNFIPCLSLCKFNYSEVLLASLAK